MADAEAEQVDVVVAQVDQGVEGVDVILRQLLLRNLPVGPADLLADDGVDALGGLLIALCLLLAARLLLLHKEIPDVPDGLHGQSKWLGWGCQKKESGRVPGQTEDTHIIEGLVTLLGILHRRPQGAHELRV